MLEADSDEGAVVRLVILFAVLPMASGCVAVRPIESGKTLALARDEGILVVHINSAIPIEKLSFSSATAGSNLPAGEHFYLLGVTAGKYRWRDIVIPASEGKVHFVMAREDAWSFRVEPGRINYPGEMTFGGRTGARRVEISAFHRNRSALALRMLRERFPELLERYPPIYSGSTRDDYLDHYGRQLSTSGKAASKATSP